MKHPSNRIAIETWLSIEIDERRLDQKEINTDPIIIETTLMAEGFPIDVAVYDCGALENGDHLYHFAFRARDRRPTPISHTGYRSLFFPLRPSTTAKDLESIADDFCQTWLEDARLNTDPEQLQLF